MTGHDTAPEGGVSTGIDMESISRVGAAVAKGGFSERVYTPGELDYALGKRRPEVHLAGGFAAKEACAKALGTGFARGVGLKDIEVVGGPGRPVLKLYAEAARLLGKRKAHLSISCAADLAVALVVIE